MSITLLIVLGGVVALDATSFGQLMLSRPMVAGTLAGFLVGLPLEGALLGTLLEAISLGILPVGAAKYPETGTAALAAAGVLGIAAVPPTATALLLALVFGLAWQRLAGSTVVGGRYINERMMRAGAAEEAATPRLDRLIEYRHVESMLLDVLRGMLLTAGALLIGVPAMRLALPHWTLAPAVAATVVAAAAAAVLAGTAPLFAESPRGRVLLLLGLLCGSLLIFSR